MEYATVDMHDITELKYYTEVVIKRVKLKSFVRVGMIDDNRASRKAFKQYIAAEQRMFRHMNKLRREIAMYEAVSGVVFDICAGVC